MSDPQKLFNALSDWSKDLQGYLQRMAASLNAQTVSDRAEIAALQQLKPTTLAASGFVTLPNGLILQWMPGTANSPGVANLLPRAFPTNNFVAFAVPTGAAVALETQATDVGHVTVTTAVAGVQNCVIFAIGN